MASLEQLITYSVHIFDKENKNVVSFQDRFDSLMRAIPIAVANMTENSIGYIENAFGLTCAVAFMDDIGDIFVTDYTGKTISYSKKKVKARIN